MVLGENLKRINRLELDYVSMRKWLPGFYLKDVVC